MAVAEWVRARSTSLYPALDAVRLRTFTSCDFIYRKRTHDNNIRNEFDLYKLLLSYYR